MKIEIKSYHRSYYETMVRNAIQQIETSSHDYFHQDIPMDLITFQRALQYELERIPKKSYKAASNCLELRLTDDCDPGKGRYDVLEIWHISNQGFRDRMIAKISE